MIHPYRAQYNAQFTPEAYHNFCNWIARQYDYKPAFKIAETPVFISNDLKGQLIEACEQIADVIVRDDFLEKSEGALVKGQQVPNETPHTTFLQMDFGICRDADGALIPQLIEVQGFPSLYFYQDLVARAYRRFFDIPEEVGHLFGGLTSEGYEGLLRDIIVGPHDPKNVILLEVEPDKQTTAIDFVATKARLGIHYCCVTDLKVSGRDVFYLDEQGKKVPVYRIYNRVIFDELIKRDDLKRDFYFSHEYDLEYIGHPHWFFRISKHTLPLLDSPYVPKSYFLNKLDRLPDDLHNYVLKPLYSFAGSGVIINLNRHDVEMVTDPENYILQRKVNYESVVPTLDDPAKVEVRMLMLWERNSPRPILVNNLVRLSKGEMIGVRYNKNKTWVGGSVGFFEGEGQ